MPPPEVAARCPRPLGPPCYATAIPHNDHPERSKDIHITVQDRNHQADHHDQIQTNVASAVDAKL